MKYAVEDAELRKAIVEYLAFTGVDIDEDTPVSITLPGAGSSPQKCLSGSGRMTAGGKFAPGYDAKLKSSLYAIIRGEPTKISEELKEHGPMYRPVEEWTADEARDVLRRFNWPEPVPPKPKAEKKPKAAKGEGEEGAEGEPTTRKGRKRAADPEAEAAATEAEPATV